MKGLKRRLAIQGICLVLENSGTSAIIDASFDQNYGARPVKRYIEKTIVTTGTLSRMLISGEIGSGCTVHIESVSVTSNNDELNDTPINESSKAFKRPRTLSYCVEKVSNMVEKIL